MKSRVVGAPPPIVGRAARFEAVYVARVSGIEWIDAARVRKWLRWSSRAVDDGMPFHRAAAINGLMTLRCRNTLFGGVIALS
ncbi:hypothetical protein P3W23_12985 [Luteibacter sp. PPL554]